MIYPSIDKLLNIVDSKYQLVHIAARRSKEMTKTEYFQIPISKYTSSKNIGRALEEVSEGLVNIKRGEELE
ncbi:MAG: DNA-directed RNA polymerase subunit omega [Bacilli bacterium]|nr:DNA-directed RNA polymerase subunit omega [Bacilli bacterium]